MPERADVTVRVFSSMAEQDHHDAAYWAALPVDVRVMQVWKLSLEQWQLQGAPPHEPGLSRSITVVRRP